MKYLIQNNRTVKGKINLPSSKSISNRLLIIRALCKDDFTINNLSDCDDTRILNTALQELDSSKIDIQNAGTAMRFLTAYLATQAGERILTGSPRMKERPIKELVEALKDLGGDIEYLEKDNFPPLKIKYQQLKRNEISIKANISSQFISALMLIAPILEKGLTINLTGKILSRDYILMTKKLMEEFGIDVLWEEKTIKIKHGEYRAKDFTVEADWSAASCWYEIVAFANKADIVLNGVSKNSIQGDSILPQIFDKIGVSTEYFPGGIRLSKNNNKPKKFSFDFISNPDLAQTLAVTLVGLSIPFKFSGLDNLNIKETNRVEALKIELLKLGGSIDDDEENIISWNGEKIKINQKEIFYSTYTDHRMAMAFAPLALIHNNVIINEPLVVTKSYPNFWEDFASVGFKITK
jgi:3-phosphoshikimate 1-carboxyvinyltransferase